MISENPYLVPPLNVSSINNNAVSKFRQASIRNRQIKVLWQIDPGKKTVFVVFMLTPAAVTAKILAYS